MNSKDSSPLSKKKPVDIPMSLLKRLQKSVKKVKSTTPYVADTLKQRIIRIPRAPSTRKVLTPSMKEAMKPIKLILDPTLFPPM